MNEKQIFSQGSFTMKLSPKEHDKRMRTFHMKHNEEMNYSCKFCKKKISAHNKDWHDHMCDDCFNKKYFPDDPFDPKFSRGTCRDCNKTFSQRAMKKHITSCIHNNGAIDSFIIRASAGPFFVYLTIPKDSTLEVLDQFLRDLWLECCGHLSQFKINTIDYMSQYGLEPGDESMLIKLFAILKPGLKFDYEYDFGTTTALELECIAEVKTLTRKPFIIARNNSFNVKCVDCKGEAMLICTYCVYSGDCFYCKRCAKKHKCEDGPNFLPLVNSPRMGECGFTGDDCKLIND